MAFNWDDIEYQPYELSRDVIPTSEVGNDLLHNLIHAERHMWKRKLNVFQYSPETFKAAVLAAYAQTGEFPVVLSIPKDSCAHVPLCYVVEMAAHLYDCVMEITNRNGSINIDQGPDAFKVKVSVFGKSLYLHQYMEGMRCDLGKLLTRCDLPRNFGLFPPAIARQVRMKCHCLDCKMRTGALYDYKNAKLAAAVASQD